MRTLSSVSWSVAAALNAGVTIVMRGSSPGRGLRLVCGALRLGLSLLTLFPGRVGGSESYVRGLLGAFADGHGPEQVAVLINRHGRTAYGERSPTMEVAHVPSYRAGDRDVTRLLAMVHAELRPRAVARTVPPGIDVLHHPLTVPIPKLDVPAVTTLL